MHFDYHDFHLRSTIKIQDGGLWTSGRKKGIILNNFGAQIPPLINSMTSTNLPDNFLRVRTGSKDLIQTIHTPDLLPSHFLKLSNANLQKFPHEEKSYHHASPV
jgi:hypothetical protein